MKITDRKYPLCSELGVLRRTSRGKLVVSTSALREGLGWETYKRYLPTMEHYRYSPGPTPESCEAFLKTLNGKVK